MRQPSIDSLKCLCMFLIIFLHCTDERNNWLVPLFRCAVPCFFMISGFLLYYSSEQTHKIRIRKNLLRVGKLLLYSLLLYCIFEESIQYLTTNEWICLSFKDSAKFLIFNKTPFGYHLWYIAAYLYVLGIIYSLSTPYFMRIITICIPLLLTLNIAFGKYSLLTLHHEVGTFYFRNFLFTGLPFFLIGRWIAIHRNRINSIKRKTLWGSFIVLILASDYEYLVLQYHKLGNLGDLYISTIPLAIVLFLLFVTHKNKYSHSFLQQIGEKYSLSVYILHILIASLIIHLSPSSFPYFWKGYPFAFSVAIISLSSTYLGYKILSFSKKYFYTCKSKL